jgi:tetratricopeptide (TPR) repeat protein
MIRPLEAALAGDPAGSRAALIHYYLGVAYARTELDKALSHLQAAIAGEVEQDDARFQLASVLDRSGAWGQARAEYDRFATAHPQSQLAVLAMRRSASLARVPLALPAGTGAAPAGPGAAIGPDGGAAAPAAAAPGAPGAGPGAAPGAVPGPARPWPRGWGKPPARPAPPAAPPSPGPAAESPADRAAEPAPPSN